MLFYRAMFYCHWTPKEPGNSAADRILSIISKDVAQVQRVLSLFPANRKLITYVVINT